MRPRGVVRPLATSSKATDLKFPRKGQVNTEIRRRRTDRNSARVSTRRTARRRYGDVPPLDKSIIDLPPARR